MLSTDPTLERTFTGQRSAVSCLSWAPHLRQLASGGSDNSVMVWNLGAQLRSFRYVGHTVRAACLHLPACLQELTGTPASAAPASLPVGSAAAV